MRKLTRELIADFKNYLIEEEKSKATVEKYERDIRAFCVWLGEKELTKGDVLNFKAYLCEKYTVSSVNSMMSSINSFFTYLEWFELRVKTVKVQKQIFASREKELTKSEYERLLLAAQKKSNKRLYFLMQGICSTGIRVSELRFITVEAINRGRAEINCKGKRRCAFLPNELCKMLKNYVREQTHLQLFLRLSIGRISEVSLLSPTVFLRKTPYAYTLAQRQYGTCNSKMHVLKYYCLCSLFSPVNLY